MAKVELSVNDKVPHSVYLLPWLQKPRMMATRKESTKYRSSWQSKCIYLCKIKFSSSSVFVFFK